MFENFFASNSKEKIPDALKSEHLREGVPPIIAGIYSLEDLKELEEETILRIRSFGDYVDYYEKPTRLEQNNMLNAGEQTYVFSSTNEKDKWSDGYKNCTGIAVVGISKKDGKNISFLSHQDPQSFLHKKKRPFENHLAKSIEEILEKTEIGTVDAVIFAGQFYGGHKEEYEDSIKKIGDISRKKLGFEPVVVAGPNLVPRSYKGTAIYLDTKNRRIYLVRASQPENITNQSYRPSDIKEEKMKWNEPGAENEFSM